MQQNPSKCAIRVQQATKPWLRERVAQLAASGHDLRECEALLRAEGFKHVDHTTLSRDLKRERQALSQSTRDTVRQHRDQTLKELLALKTGVYERGRALRGKDPSYVNDLLNIFDRLMRLLGLSAADQVHDSGETDPERMGQYHRFLHETTFVSESEFPQIWKLCKELSKPPSDADVQEILAELKDDDESVN